MKRLTPILFVLLWAAGGAVVSAEDTNTPAGNDFNSFEIVAKKNIFDQSRTGIARSRPPQPRIEHIILQGIGGGLGDAEVYFKGGGAPDRMLKVGDHIGGFELSRITPDSVKLTNSTNTFVLDLETRRSLRRVDDGPWEGSSDQADSVNISTNTVGETAVSSPTAADASHPGESAIERKLRLRREQEEK